ncbi:hypothetical protein Y032_0933g3102 [Ancylostoma ceylanicum]|uniref:Uncharacterized protein n=1 Tax=Ancylostoma ceylanicum TaxID=53326 RepID=A0A016W945_9BILA|nr:hypothetical protein Y032_0933g3102 [Ancylostoma ceylanicum]
MLNSETTPQDICIVISIIRKRTGVRIIRLDSMSTFRYRVKRLLKTTVERLIQNCIHVNYQLPFLIHHTENETFPARSSNQLPCESKEVIARTAIFFSCFFTLSLRWKHPSQDQVIIWQ